MIFNLFLGPPPGRARGRVRPVSFLKEIRGLGPIPARIRGVMYFLIFICALEFVYGANFRCVRLSSLTRLKGYWCQLWPETGPKHQTHKISFDFNFGPQRSWGRNIQRHSTSKEEVDVGNDLCSSACFIGSKAVKMVFRFNCLDG